MKELSANSLLLVKIIPPAAKAIQAMSISIPPSQLEYYEKHASDNKQPNLIATIILCLALPCIAVFLRFVARCRARAGFKADDWLVLLALVRNRLSPGRPES